MNKICILEDIYKSGSTSFMAICGMRKMGKKEISFFECKWSSLNNKEAEIILAELKRKAALVKWHNTRRKERYGIIAKDIKDKEKLISMGYFVFDLRDFATIHATHPHL